MPNGIHPNPFLDSARDPKSTPQALHKAADEWFLKRFGVLARSQSIICSTDLKQAREYATGGITAAIEPIGDYLAIYSPKVRDFLDVFVEYSAYQSDSFDLENFNSILEAKVYVHTDDLARIDSRFKGEVLLHCTSFHLTCIDEMRL